MFLCRYILLRVSLEDCEVDLDNLTFKGYRGEGEVFILGFFGKQLLFGGTFSLGFFVCLVGWVFVSLFDFGFSRQDFSTKQS